MPYYKVNISNRVMRILYIVLFLSVSFIVSCDSKKNTTTPNASVNTDSTNYIDEEGPRSVLPKIDNETIETRKIKDGSYTADVEYYNTTTGINTLYVTKVHVEDGYLKVIKWPNGVWLASEYFKPQKIRKDGTCIISNIEAGYENRVKILDLQYY